MFIIQLSSHRLVFCVKIFIFKMHYNGLSLHLLNKSSLVSSKKIIVQGSQIFLAAAFIRGTVNTFLDSYDLRSIDEMVS